MTASLWKPPACACIAYPDSPRYKGGFGIASQSSGRIYKISFDTAQMCWVCSCPGAIRHGQCKHLSAAALKGRSARAPVSWGPVMTGPRPPAWHVWLGVLVVAVLLALIIGVVIPSLITVR